MNNVKHIQVKVILHFTIPESLSSFMPKRALLEATHTYCAIDAIKVARDAACANPITLEVLDD